jgi:hypothetical protein
VRKLADSRARQIRFRRFLNNVRVKVTEIVEAVGERTASLVGGRNVLAIQDTTEVNYQSQADRKHNLGTVGNGTDSRPLRLPSSFSGASSLWRALVDGRPTKTEAFDYLTRTQAVLHTPNCKPVGPYCKPENKVSLGFVEGLNNKIRVIQRRACEYAMKSTVASKCLPACCRCCDVFHLGFGPKSAHTTSRRPCLKGEGLASCAALFLPICAAISGSSGSSVPLALAKTNAPHADFVCPASGAKNPM